jgi:hypothetical protein
MSRYSILTLEKRSLPVNRQPYLDFFEKLIDRAIRGECALAHFCDDIVLELYRDGDELHWRRLDGKNTSRSDDEND